MDSQDRSTKLLLDRQEQENEERKFILDAAKQNIEGKSKRHPASYVVIGVIAIFSLLVGGPTAVRPVLEWLTTMSPLIEEPHQR